ncbi:MAG TPA: VOC family protein [Solirubrobacteraceae bacterium]|nr:VOC family protein [Solirubrobacteraceae bacterium]
MTIRVDDLAGSRHFYDTVLAPLGVQRSGADAWGHFRIAPASADDPATRRLHIGFGAASLEHVGAFWQAGIDAGYRDDGEPGPRPVYGDDYYGSFLLDPDANSAEAALHDSVGPGVIDHLWIRVTDLAAVREFYLSIAPPAGLHLGTDTAERVQFRGDGGSFSLLPGDEPTEHVELAFAGGEPGAFTDPAGNRVQIV